MTTLYKLTDAHDQTHGRCQWGAGVTVETTGIGPLCGPGWTHWYTDSLLAVLLNPIHGEYDLATAHLWEGEGEIGETDHGLKVGCAKATTLRRIDLPPVTTEQSVRFGVLAARAVSAEPSFVRWSGRWLNGDDRSAEWASASAARAAYKASAVVAAWSVVAAEAARAAVVAARTAYKASAEAARAARAAAWTAPLDLIALARQAVAEGGTP